MLTENVKKLLKENMWDLATCSAGVPNVVPVAFKDVTDDGKTLEGYQIRGTAKHVADGPVVAAFKAMVEQMFQGAATAKGALVITPETVIVTTPGADVPCVSRPFLHTCIRGETAVCCRQQTAERSHFYAHCSSL